MEKGRLGSTRSTRGSSINEILVTMTLLGMFVLALFGFYRSQLLMLQAFRAKVDVKERSGAGLGFLLNEIRMAGSRPVPDGFPPAGCAVPAAPPPPGVVCEGFAAIEQASPTMIAIRYDYRDEDLADDLDGNPDADGCPDDPNEAIQYRYDAAGRRILRAANGEENAVARGVSQFTLRYFAQDGTEVTNGGDPLTAEQRIRDIASVVLSFEVEDSSRSATVRGNVRSRQTSTIQVRSPLC